LNFQDALHAFDSRVRLKRDGTRTEPDFVFRRAQL